MLTLVPQQFHTQQQIQLIILFHHPSQTNHLQTKQIQSNTTHHPLFHMSQSLQQNPELNHPQNSQSSPVKTLDVKNSSTQMQQSQSLHVNDSHNNNHYQMGDSNAVMHHSMQHQRESQVQNDQAGSKKNASKSPTELFQQARKILKKSPEIRTPNDNQLLYQLTQHSEFLSQLVQNVSLQCFKGIMKQAKIQQVRQRQLLCQQGKPITHIVILLDGKVGICKQQDDFSTQMQQAQQSQGQKTPTLLKSGQSQFPHAKHSMKQKQTKTIQTIVQMDNIYDELTALSCKQIDTIRKKNAQLKRKSSVPLTAGLFLPMPFTKEQFEGYEIESYLSPGEEYGAKARCKSKIHSNTCFAVEKSTLLIIEFNLIIYWFEHSFRGKLGATIQKLKKLPAFSFLQDGKLAECILHMKKQKRRRNDHIYRQGAQSQKLYILLHGQIKFSKQAKLFEQNPNELYMNRKKLMHKNTDPLKKQDESKRIDALPYANLTALYNFRPMKKIIEMGIIASGQDCFSLIGEQELIQKRPRETSAIVASFDCQYYEIEVRKLEQILGSKFIEEFYEHLEKSLKRTILYHQNQYAEKVNLQNRHNLDYFYFEDNKSKESPRKYKLQKINNKFNDTKPVPIFTKTLNEHPKAPQPFESDTIKPYYTTFNFHKLVKTQRLTHTRKLSERQAKQNSARKRNDSEDSHENIKMKFDAVEERMIDISHTWKPIRKKVIQEIKVMQKISPKRHFIDINQPLIEQKYFRDLEKEQKRIDKEHRVFVLSLGKRTKW